MDEDFNQLVMECNNCHLQFYAAELKTNAATNTLMCRNCLQAPGSRINVLKDRPLAQKKKEPTIIRQAIPVVKKESPVEEGYAIFECNSCSYVFKRIREFNGSCPYCNKKSY